MKFTRTIIPPVIIVMKKVRRKNRFLGVVTGPSEAEVEHAFKLWHEVWIKDDTLNDNIRDLNTGLAVSGNLGLGI